VPGSVVPRLGNAFAAITVPVLLILDDVHVLRNSECRAALSAGPAAFGVRLSASRRPSPPETAPARHHQGSSASGRP